MKIDNNQFKKDLNEVLEHKIITIYWWNMGKKTLDFTGKYKDFFKKKDITFRVSEKKQGKDIFKYLNFNIPVGSNVIKLRSYWSGSDWDFKENCDKAIILFLTLLGDKTLFNSQMREVKINWR